MLGFTKEGDHLGLNSQEKTKPTVNVPENDHISKEKLLDSTFKIYSKSVNNAQDDDDKQKKELATDGFTGNRKLSSDFVDYDSKPNIYKRGDEIRSSNDNDAQNLHLQRPQKPLRRDELFGRRSLREPTSKEYGSEKRSQLIYEKTKDYSSTRSNSTQQPSYIKISSPESKKKDIYHHTPKEVHLEIVDSSRRSLPASLEKRKNKSSLFEWEAIQRQRIEDEEKNRLNKNISIKPVSSKIKDLVKIHSGIVASMFSKDRKGEYNGTVDAKEEIFFQKIPSDKNKDSLNKNYNNPMKSPYIVQTILSPNLPKEKAIIPKHIPKNVNPSLERETYIFNQRNIYIDNDTIQRQRTKEKKKGTETVQDLIGKREKKMESSDGKQYSTDKNKVTQNDSHHLVSSKLIKEATETSKTDNAYKRKEWVNNIINKLETVKLESSSGDNKPVKEADGVQNRNSPYRKSFHEYLPRKKLDISESIIAEKSKTEGRIVSSINESIAHLKREEPKKIYERKTKGRGPVNLTSIIGESPSVSSSCLSTPLTSPRESPERQVFREFSKPQTFSENTKNFYSGQREKENVCPYQEIGSDIGRFSHNGQPSTPSEKLRNILDRSNPNRRSVSKLLMEWEEKTQRERSASPASFSEGHDASNQSKYDYSFHPSIPSRFKRERSLSLRSNSSIRSTPERDSGPVSLSSILERDVTSPSSSTHRLSISEELSELTQNYRKEKAKYQLSKEDQFTSPSKTNYLLGAGDKERDGKPEIQSKKETQRKHYSSSQSKSGETSRKKKQSSKDSSKIYLTSKTIKKQVKESHIYNNDKESKPRPRKEEVKPSFQTKNSSKLVRRKSSLKRSQSGDSTSLSSYKRRVKSDPKREEIRSAKGSKRSENSVSRKAKESDTASERYESIKHKPGGGWTKTSVRKVKLGSETSDKTLCKEKEKRVKDKHFSVEASKELEKWAAGTQVHGKLMKKEGQKYSHHVEEEVEGGKKSSKAVSRRIVRRGSRRMSDGGELVSETKEMASSGDPGGDAGSEKTSVALYNGGADPTSRKIKSSTDGERFVTQSMSTDEGGRRFTTEGVDNKTTKSVEVIGGDGWEGERAVKGRHGERLVVQHVLGSDGRPSTVVTKSTSQSKFIITKTKKKPFLAP